MFSREDLEKFLKNIMQQILFWLLIGGGVGSVGIYLLSLTHLKKKEQSLKEAFIEKSQILEKDFNERIHRE